MIGNRMDCKKLWNGWEIRRTLIPGDTYFISKYHPNHPISYSYLHKDYTIHDFCGRENYWDSIEEAEKFFEYWSAGEAIKRMDFLTKEEFTI